MRIFMPKNQERYLRTRHSDTSDVSKLYTLHVLHRTWNMNV